MTGRGGETAVLQGSAPIEWTYNGRREENSLTLHLLFDSNLMLSKLILTPQKSAKASGILSHGSAITSIKSQHFQTLEFYWGL